MFKVKIDNNTYHAVLRPAQRIHLCGILLRPLNYTWILGIQKNGSTIESSEEAVSYMATEDCIDWNTATIIKLPPHKIDFYIPDQLRAFLTVCHKRYLKLLTFL
jgi:hypothetical protein